MSISCYFLTQKQSVCLFSNRWMSQLIALFHIQEVVILIHGLNQWERQSVFICLQCITTFSLQLLLSSLHQGETSRVLGDVFLLQNSDNNVKTHLKEDIAICLTFSNYLWTWQIDSEVTSYCIRKAYFLFAEEPPLRIIQSSRESFSSKFFGLVLSLIWNRNSIKAPHAREQVVMNNRWRVTKAAGISEWKWNCSQRYGGRKYRLVGVKVLRLGHSPRPFLM